MEMKSLGTCYLYEVTKTGMTKCFGEVFHQDAITKEDGHTIPGTTAFRPQQGGSVIVASEEGCILDGTIWYYDDEPEEALKKLYKAERAKLARLNNDVYRQEMIVLNLKAKLQKDRAPNKGSFFFYAKITFPIMKTIHKKE